ncbi:MAG: dehydrogenase, partial [Planctomycetales bacterium]|nr:dehydrogenase [Planctomycetales bacterium]
MTVPDGFKVELVASEPDVINPVAMTIDEQGRFWITESFEYPRREPGPGRDRIKVLEDTDQDGKVDKVTIFAEGLNIPSGIAVGHGGVWVANSPDILFLQDTDGDGRADHQEVVVTGFGRDDTHELPNSLTWGPDGWLYGLNGVFNRSVVRQGDNEFDFTCALFRIHPRTREFQLFCEGTSNPWGVAFDTEGSAFISACVIDHLWHLTESGYYHRQGGPYPPHTWKLQSIVDYKHQMAAYCGITYFDSDAYPAQYREKLYMGNIHGNCINTDFITRNGSTYQGHPDPDFLSANDVWFMPVVQKTGPDGCLYVLDWYDRYHCYQDANRDPAGIDRGRGRLYRIRYQDTPRAPKFDLAKESDEQLIARLGSNNVFYRDLAQRLLAERNSATARGQLERMALDMKVARKTRLHALWTLIGCGELNEAFHLQLLRDADPTFRAWGVRAAGNQG